MKEALYYAYFFTSHIRAACRKTPQVLVPAPVALDAQKAMFEQTAFEVVFILSSEALLLSVRHSIVLGKNIHSAEFSQGTFSCHSAVLDKPTRISIMPDETNKIENSMLTLSTHREILKFLNDAVRAEDLVHGRQSTAHVHPAEGHAEHESKEKKLETAEDRA